MDRAVPRRRNKRAWLIGAASAVVLLAGGVAAWRMAPGANDLVVEREALSIAAAVRAPFEDVLPLRGQVVPRDTVQINALEGGQVRAVLVQDGADVVAGQPLALLSNPRLSMEVSTREAEIAGQLGDIRGQQLQIARNRLDREREIGDVTYNLLTAQRQLSIRETLHRGGFVSDAGLAQAQAEASHYQARLRMLQASQGSEETLVKGQLRGVQESDLHLRQTLDRVRASLDALTIRAPATGRLTAFDLQPGQALEAGGKIAQIDSVDAFKLSADVDEFYLARTVTGQSASVLIDGRAWPLTVVKVLPQVVDGRFKIELAFTGARPSDLRRGQTLDLKLRLGETRLALIVPSGPWVDSAGGAYAYVLSADGRRAERRAVKLGRRGATQVEVVSGLHPGDRVITTSYADFDNRPRLMLR